ncbi:ABC transporter permease [Sphingobacterium paludis]|uniref:Putative ABC transport system permease protein n=1 Tax=Sphingobacterium paludis TaxID=1476465 RepID=A0A4R7D4Y0_9SPHI|nr:ABC transporter permease [Sphingobacterium paludis]TDS15950.1 putative ABC transport system permease protein [Sphingobacterium paludis]
MLKNYIKIAWRNLLKNKGYSSINILGLAIGLACCLLIVLYIQDELSFDHYHEKKDRIYRVVHDWKEKNGMETHQIWGNAPVGAALKADFPEVQKVVQFSGQISILLKHGEKAFQEERIFCMDSTAFDVFSWKFIAGNPQTALTAPYSIVLTETMAKKYFGDSNPIGQTLEGGVTGGRAAPGIYTVTAVIDDLPSNSHFSFDALLSMSSFRQSWSEVFDQWGYVDFYTYLLLPEDYDITKLETQVPDFITRHQASQEGKYSIHFEPLLGAYLNSKADRQPGPVGSMQNIYIFSIIGVFILCIACVNFMNLATSRSLERAKEVGVRKVVGANRKNLIVQFMSESLMLVFFASLLALALVVCLLPFVELFAGKRFTFASLFNPVTFSLFIGIVLTTSLLAASYPAFVLANFKPVKVFKGASHSAAGGAWLRKGLVVFQFGLSIALIAGTFIVFSQLRHLQQTDLGFEKTQMLVVDFNYDDQVLQNLEAIKQTLAQQKDVLSVSASRSIPGSYFPNAGTQVELPDGEMKVLNQAIFEVDVDFISNFGVQMAAGRPYSRDFPADTIHSLVINEAAAKIWGYSDPEKIIGKRFAQWGREGQVIGVVKDFNYLSLHQKVEPLTLRLEPLSSKFITLKIRNAGTLETVAELADIWKKAAPHRPFLYSFLDESFNRQYEADYRFRRLFSAFSGLALFIASLGLLGLATYTAQQRTKEIGIRKVLGASTFSIVKLLSVDFLRLVTMAIFIAVPLAWWAMNLWLNDFAYHITIQWWIFAMAGAAALFIAIFTVSGQAIRASLANPVDSLRDE